MKQGFVAAKNGRELEDLVRQVFQHQDYRWVEKQKFFKEAKKNCNKIYTQQVKLCESIYSTPKNPHSIVVDFLLFGSKKGFLICECKSQTSAGSVDEKYPYLNENIKEKYPYPTIVVLDAPAAKPGAKLWLKKQLENNRKLQEVFLSFSEFRAWAIQQL